MAKQVFTTGQILTAAQMTTLQANDYNQTVSAKTANYTLVAADAGTRITMNNAGATTITVNTSVFTAGDTLTITNIGAGVCTITAGTATVSTSSTLALKQYDSGQLYFTSTGVAIFFASDAADSPLTTKGDLFTFSTNDARLAVGNSGETLVADSAATVGLRYSPAPSTGNPVINSAMQVWQRGTSFASAASATYTADRWGYFFGGASNYTISRETTSDTTNLPFIQYCARLKRASGNTQTAQQYFANVFESINSIPFVGKTVTLSYYARVGADYSGGSSFRGTIASGTTTDVSLFSGVATNNVAVSTPTLTTTWQRFTASGTILTTQTQICVYLTWTPSGTAGANDYVEITGVQIDLGSVALPFRTQNSTLQGELAACQRYCFAVTSGATDRTTSQGAYYNSTTFVSTVAFPVTMRTVPSATIVSSTNYWIIYANNTTDTADAASFGGAGLNAGNLEITGNVSGTTGHGGQLRTNNAAASVILSAEL